ncbi:MAG: ABC transporter permease [SAR324 cluster bacterium]|nr:ABC transporter permease [SAR324 cluster bacterium]
MLEFKIAFRNLFRQRSRSLLSGLSMMLAFMLLSLSLGFGEGSYSNIIRLLTDNQTGHIQIHQQGYLDRPTLYKNFEVTPEITQILENEPAVKAFSSRVHSAGLIFGEQKSSIVRLIGMDPEKEPQVSQITALVHTGNYFDEVNVRNPLLLGYGAQRLLQTKLGDEVILLTQGADGSMANDLFTVTGIVGNESDPSTANTAYVPLSVIQQFLTMGNQVHEVVIRLNSYKDSRRETKVLSKKISDESLDIEPWEVVASDFYKAMQVDKQGNWVSIIVIMIMVGVVVLNTVLMNTLERQSEFGVMKALGTAPWLIFRAILLEMFLLSLISCGIGGVLALGLNYYFTVAGIPVDPPIEFGGIVFEKMVSEVSWFVFWVPGLLTIATAVIVAVYPAIKAARTIPVKAIRGE